MTLSLHEGEARRPGAGNDNTAIASIMGAETGGIGIDIDADRGEGPQSQSYGGGCFFGYGAGETKADMHVSAVLGSQSCLCESLRNGGKNCRNGRIQVRIEIGKAAFGLAHEIAIPAADTDPAFRAAAINPHEKPVLSHAILLKPGQYQNNTYMEENSAGIILVLSGLKAKGGQVKRKPITIMSQRGSLLPGQHRDRVVLVTGASRGIGRAALRALAQAGAHVVATARSLDALVGLDSEAKSLGGEATLAACEMSEAKDIDDLSELIRNRFGRLDGLFGNAGILGRKQAIGELPPADFESALAINLTANFRLLHRLDMLLRKSPAGRALFVTSGVAWKRHAGWAPYAVSKAGLEALVGVYAHEIEGTTVRANLISPGPIRTELRTEAWPEEDPDSVPLPEALAPSILTMLAPDFDRNGVIFDFKSGHYTSCQPPAAV